MEDGRRGGVLGEGVLDVFFDDATVGAGALDGSEVEVVFLGEAAGEGAGAVGGGCCGFGGGGSRQWRGEGVGRFFDSEHVAGDSG